MRSKTKVLVNGQDYWIYELTVNDIFSFYHDVGNIDIAENIFLDFFNNKTILQLKAITSCPLNVLTSLPVSEFKDFVQVFLQQNNQFFSNKKQSKSSDDSSSSSEDFINNLFELCCNMIEAGYPNIFEYGYSFFIKIINNHEKIKSRQIAETAIAIRVAQHSDEKQWKKYLRGLGVK